MSIANFRGNPHFFVIMSELHLRRISIFPPPLRRGIKGVGKNQSSQKLVRITESYKKIRHCEIYIANRNESR
ncbi:hypothetical protein [Helicobacter sp. 23-1045]